MTPLKRMKYKNMRGLIRERGKRNRPKHIHIYYVYLRGLEKGIIGVEEED